MTGPASTATPFCAFRPARREDVPALLRLITALAESEKLPPPDAGAAARLEADGFGGAPRFEAWLAFPPDSDEPAAYAILFGTYSTFLARPGLYLEDLFVLPQHRGRGIGTAFLDHCIGLARERGCGRLEWSALDWNTRAQALYERHGARRLSEWVYYRLDGPALHGGGPR